MLEGLRRDGCVLVNSPRDASTNSAWPTSWSACRPDALLTVPATELALKHVGRPLPNAALLGGFAALTGLISLESVAHGDPATGSRRGRRGQRRRPPRRPSSTCAHEMRRSPDA